MSRRPAGLVATLAMALVAGCGVQPQDAPDVISPPLAPPSPVHTVSDAATPSAHPRDARSAPSRRPYLRVSTVD